MAESARHGSGGRGERPGESRFRHRASAGQGRDFPARAADCGRVRSADRGSADTGPRTTRANRFDRHRRSACPSGRLPMRPGCRARRANAGAGASATRGALRETRPERGLRGRVTRAVCPSRARANRGRSARPSRPSRTRPGRCLARLPSPDGSSGARPAPTNPRRERQDLLPVPSAFHPPVRPAAPDTAARLFRRRSLCAKRSPEARGRVRF
jgi:hypothetical protein